MKHEGHTCSDHAACGRPIAPVLRFDRRNRDSKKADPHLSRMDEYRARERVFAVILGSEHWHVDDSDRLHGQVQGWKRNREQKNCVQPGKPLTYASPIPPGPGRTENDGVARTGIAWRRKDFIGIASTILSQVSVGTIA
jgi:hypothetical protein